MTVNMSNSESRKREAHVYDSPEGANEPTPDPLRAALQGLADEFDTRAQAVKAESDGIYCAYANARDMAARILAAHPEPEREDSVVERVRAALAFTDPENGVSCGGLSLDAPGCFASDLAARVQAAIAPPVAHQDTEREGGMVENLCPCASPSYSHLPSQHRPVPPAPETDEAAATLAEVEKLFRGTFFGDFGGHDWRGGDATVQEFARDLGRLLHDYRKQADR